MRWLHFRELQFSSICFTLFFAIFIGPLLDEFTAAGTVVAIVITVVMLNAVYTMSDHPRLVWVAVALGIPGTLLRWADLSDFGAWFTGIALATEVALLSLTLVLILRRVLAARKVTSEVIYGSIAAYLLLGFTWAMVYSWMAAGNPGAFSVGVSPTPADWGPWMYYSFVTLTTLGYGDIQPLTVAARSLSSAEALVGQLFLTVLVARLVGMQVAQRASGSD